MRLFLRDGPAVYYGEIMDAESAQPITVHHFTGSDACHVIKKFNLWYANQRVNFCKLEK